MASSSTLRGVSSDANEQIRNLRQQVDQLMRDRVTPIMSDAAGRAQDYARQAGDVARDQTEALSGQIRDMPIPAVLVAAAIGYLLGRFTR